jgi:hypothetical protein
VDDISAGRVEAVLTLIGYWAGEGLDEWPDPRSFVDLTWDALERSIVVDYLKRGFVARACMGMSPCRFCGKLNGSLELTDGVFVWPEGFAHYLEEHGVRPPDSFVDHVNRMVDKLESEPIDQEWWRSYKPGG